MQVRMTLLLVIGVRKWTIAIEYSFLGHLAHLAEIESGSRARSAAAGQRFCMVALSSFASVAGA